MVPESASKQSAQGSWSSYVQLVDMYLTIILLFIFHGGRKGIRWMAYATFLIIPVKIRTRKWKLMYHPALIRNFSPHFPLLFRIFIMTHHRRANQGSNSSCQGLLWDQGVNSE